MGWSFPLGRLFGSELRVHVTFLLLLVFVAGSAFGAGGMPAAVANTGFVLALFACVIAHEYGHALMARRFGIRTPDITLLPIGGLARLERMPRAPRDESLVALAGPAVNLVIWAGLMLLGAPLSAQGAAETAGMLLGQLTAANLFLALFNLVPAFPMDGGRVLRALLTLAMSRHRATRLAGRTGQALSVLLGLWGIASGNLILVLIAGFLIFVAQAEIAATGRDDTRAGPGKPALRDVMVTRFVTLAPSDPLRDAAQALDDLRQDAAPVLARDGRLAGMLSRAALDDARAPDGGRLTVGDVMDDRVRGLPATTPLGMVAARLSDAQSVVAVDRAGRVVGYVTRSMLPEIEARLASG